MNKNKKIPLYRAVQQIKEPYWVIMGALSYHGLLDQYKEEKLKHEVEECKATITLNDLEKKIKQFKEGK